MRFKLTFGESSMYSCCWFFHVRTGTIFFGVLTLLLQLAAVCFIAVFTMRPDLSEIFEHRPEMLDLNTPTSEQRLEAKFWWLSRKNWTDDDKFVAMLFTGGCIFSTILLIYGALKGKASHMVPFMGLQMFDFCITSLVVISYFSYVPDVKLWIKQQEGTFPLKQRLMDMEADWMMLVIVLSAVAVLVIKAYLIGIVWSCYKFLTQHQRTIRTNAYRRDDLMFYPTDTEMLLPPKYEDIILLPSDSTVISQPAPPPYAG